MEQEQLQRLAALMEEQQKMIEAHTHTCISTHTVRYSTHAHISRHYVHTKVYIHMCISTPRISRVASSRSQSGATQGLKQENKRLAEAQQAQRRVQERVCCTAPC
jgi:hypothetical protein